MAAPSDNSTETSSNESSHHTGEGVVMDIGTGDGRFVSAAARANPNKFYIGIDANAKALAKISTKATRKVKKGGLSNAIFVQAAVEDLPAEFDATADEIHIHFPWGSLLRSVATGDKHILHSLRRIASPGCLLEIVIGIDPVRDRSELDRLGVPVLSPVILHSYLIPKYLSAGFELLDSGILDHSRWAAMESSWARKLKTGEGRTVTFMLFSASKR